MADKSHTTNPTKNTITRRNVLKATGALIGTAAIGVAGNALAKTPAFDPSRFIHVADALGYQNVVAIKSDGRKSWWIGHPDGFGSNGEGDDIFFDLLAEINTTPGARKHVADYLIKTGRVTYG